MDLQNFFLSIMGAVMFVCMLGIAAAAILYSRNVMLFVCAITLAASGNLTLNALAGQIPQMPISVLALMLTNTVFCAMLLNRYRNLVHLLRMAHEQDVASEKAKAGPEQHSHA